MAIQWQDLLFKILIWFALEIFLNLLGFDDLADYSEFILETKKTNFYQIHKENSILAIQGNFNGAFYLLPNAALQWDALPNSRLFTL